MSKAISKDLFNLIHSLSKSEKRNFMLFAERSSAAATKKFIRLFKAIDRQKKYNESAILAKEPQFKKEQFSNMKAHLYEQILRSVLMLNEKKTIDVTLHGMLAKAHLLYYKSLYRQSLKLLEKARHIAKENDRQLFLLTITDLEKQILPHTLAAKNESRVDELIRMSENAGRSVNNTNVFSNISLRLTSHYMNIGFIRNKKDFDSIRSFFKSNMPAYNETLLSFHEKLYLYYCYTGYYYFIQDFENGYSYAKKMAGLFDQYPLLIYHKLELYIKSLNNLLVAQNKLSMYTSFIETQKKLLAIKRLPRYLLNENVNLNLFKTIYIHEINRHFMLGEFKAGTKIISRLENELNAFITQLDEQTVLIFYYKIACLYFGASDFRTALFWLNKIINAREINIREDIHAFARILAMISYFELEYTDLLESSIRSTYRFLLKKGDLNLYQKYILQFLKKLGNDITIKNINNYFAELKNKLNPLEVHRFEKRPFLYFDIISWLESRIENKPVEEIIKAKAIKKIK